MSIIDLKHINPGWDNGREEYKINCVNCAIATDAFLRGFKFEAKSSSKHKEILNIYNFYDYKLTEEAESDDYLSFSKMLDEITFKKQRGFAIISPDPDSFDYNDTSEIKIKSRHIVNILLIEEIVYLLDGQRNLVFPVVDPPSVYLPNKASYCFLSIDTNDNSFFSDREKVERFCIFPEDVST
jgi:hypothetical protein